MFLKNNLVLVWVVCLLYKVVVTGCEVVLVNRNVTDSFRVGQDGCTNNASACTSSSSRCQSDSGLCLCSSDTPNYRNPVIKRGDKLVYDDSYGCVNNLYIRAGVGTTECPFKPFQLIPYSHNNPVTNFSHDAMVFSCSLKASWAKFPDNATEMELQWLKESYVDLSILNRTLQFKWKKSVPDLQGKIITLSLQCMVPNINNPQLKSYQKKCLRAKVLGTWSAEVKSTDPTTSVLNPNTTMTKSPTLLVSNPNATTSNSPTTSARSSPPGEVSSNDDDSSGTIIVIAVVVPIALLVILVVVVWLVCKRKRGHRQRNSSRGNSGKENDTSSMKQFRHTDSNLRGPDAYADVPAKDTTQTFGAQTNPAYATPDSQRVVVEANPTYATPDIKKREFNGANSYPEPGYETPDVKRKDAIEATSDSAYSTLDDKKRDVNPGYSTPDSDTRKEEDNADLPTPDIKRVEVNGDLYALPDKNTKKDNGLNYMDPSELVSGGQGKNESNDQSGQPTEYADIVGVMKAKPKKKK